MVIADLVVRNGTVVTPRGRGELDIAARDGRIVAIAGRGGLGRSTAEEVDARGRFVLPGVIDGHVFTRPCGRAPRSTATRSSRASRAAA